MTHLTFRLKLLTYMVKKQKQKQNLNFWKQNKSGVTFVLILSRNCLLNPLIHINKLV